MASELLFLTIIVSWILFISADEFGNVWSVPNVPLEDIRQSKDLHTTIETISRRISWAALNATKRSRRDVSPIHTFNTITPADGMVITESVSFTQGTYKLKTGIFINASNIMVDGNGAQFLGPLNEQSSNDTTTSVGITILSNTNSNFKNIEISNINIHSFYYGIVARNATNIKILDCNLSHNWYALFGACSLAKVRNSWLLSKNQ